MNPRCAYAWQTTGDDMAMFHTCTQPPGHDAPHECKCGATRHD